MSSNKNSSVIIWAGVAAAIGGIVAVVAIASVRGYGAKPRDAATQLRNVQDVLDDCYLKIHEIEQRLPDMGAVVSASPAPVPE